jgi:glucan 1,3-beta-glucosidase
MATYKGGSILFLDSKFVNCVYGIVVTSPNGATSSQQFSITLDNLVLESVPNAVSKNLTPTLLGGTRTIVSWTLGKVYDKSNPDGKFQSGASLADDRPDSSMLCGGPNGGYLERTKPQYQELGYQNILNANLLANGKSFYWVNSFILTR